jgi:hypothetical protein
MGEHSLDRLKMGMFKSNEDQAVMPGRQLAITEVD